jgi:hypothetical protein
MIVRRAILAAIALSSAGIASGIAANEPNRTATSPTQPVFLLSERDLGTGFKVCFLSNGLQMRLPVSQICPYPLKAPPLAPEQLQLAAQPASAIAKESAVLTEMSKEANLVEPAPMQPQSLQPLPSRPSATPAAAAKSPQTRKPVEVPKPPPPSTSISQPKVQPVLARAGAPESRSQTVSVTPSPVTPAESDDLIADKAIRRCERIGFKAGTEPFKSCALEQIRILSGVKPT